MKEQKEPLLQLAENELSTAAIGSTWLEEIRRENLRLFLNLGIPTTRQEAWRFTNLRPLKGIRFQPDQPDLSGSGVEKVSSAQFADLECPRLAFFNGHLAPGLSTGRNWPEGVRVSTLSEAIENEDAILKEHFGQVVDTSNQPFAALNTALFADGALIEIKPGAIVEQAIQILFITTSGNRTPVLSTPRVLIIAGENVQANVIETHLGIGDETYLTIPVTEVFAGPGAVLNHHKITLESPAAFHLGNFSGYESAGARISTIDFTFGGAIVRNDTMTSLEGESAWAELDGLYLASNNQHVDHYTTINHAQPHCDSREHYKGILADRSRGVFRGRIIVAKGAQKTDSKQTNNNLLLSDDATINIKPQLEIYADDVKCTHGATVGRLDKDILFYLQARGISKEMARSILVYAFAGEIISRVKIEKLREELNEYLFTRLPHGELLQAAN